MALRILASFVLLFSVLFMPFWVTTVFALAGMVYFRFYLEAVFLFFLSDLIFASSEAKILGVTFFSSLASVLILIFIELLKKRLKFYDLR